MLWYSSMYCFLIFWLCPSSEAAFEDRMHHCWPIKAVPFQSLLEMQPFWNAYFTSQAMKDNKYILRGPNYLKIYCATVTTGSLKNQPNRQTKENIVGWCVRSEVQLMSFFLFSFLGLVEFICSFIHLKNACPKGYQEFWYFARPVSARLVITFWSNFYIKM